MKLSIAKMTKEALLRCFLIANARIRARAEFRICTWQPWRADRRRRRVSSDVIIATEIAR